MNFYKKLFLSNFVLLLLFNTARVDNPFPASFGDASGVCYGGIHIRTKTLDWHTQYVSCKKVPYTLMYQDRYFDQKFKSEFNIWVLKFNAKLTQTCPFDSIAIYSPPLEKPDYSYTFFGLNQTKDYKKGLKKLLEENPVCGMFKNYSQAT